jgi:hypothetical protein
VFEVTVDRINALVEIVVEGQILVQEMERLLSALKAVLASLQGRGILIRADVRGLRPVAPEVGERLRRGLDQAMGIGVRRIAAIVESELVALQLQRLARESGAERALRCFRDEAPAVEWLLHGDLEPGSKPRG